MFVNVAPFSTATIEDYGALVGAERVARLRERGRDLRGLKVLHINAAHVGGGVAEILYSLVPLMRDVGLEVDWYVLEGDDGFFEVTKTIHNALQGQDVEWTPEMLRTYLRLNEANAVELSRRIGDYDVVVVHDPQPLALAGMLPAGGARIWRCHIDMTSPNPGVWETLAPYLDAYDAAVFSTPEYVPPGLNVPTATALPCIDPFRPKNRPLEPEEVAGVMLKYGIDTTRPYMLQVSRFDPWKDPLGVVEAYRLLKGTWPAMQLVYMASMAVDDPEGHRVYQEVKAAANGDPDVRLLALNVPIEAVDRNAFEVNAMQLGARVVLQKSLREGFGLTVSEALWKERPVVAGDVGGIRYQIRDGWNGYLVRSVEECADRVARVLDEPDMARELGRRGRETVRDNFLFTRLLDQYLGWFGQLVAGAAPPALSQNGDGDGHRAAGRARTESVPSAGD